MCSRNTIWSHLIILPKQKYESGLTIFMIIPQMQNDRFYNTFCFTISKPKNMYIIDRKQCTVQFLWPPMVSAAFHSVEGVTHPWTKIYVKTFMYYSAVDGKVERMASREGLQVYVDTLVFCLKGPKHEIFGSMVLMQSKPGVASQIFV